MRVISSTIPAFSAGPLLMPPIQLTALRVPSCTPVVEDRTARNYTRGTAPGGPTNSRKFGTRFLFAARVRPLTLSALIRDESTGIPPLTQIEAYVWGQACNRSAGRNLRPIRREEYL